MYCGKIVNIFAKFKKKNKCFASQGQYSSFPDRIEHVKMEGFSSTFCLSDKILFGVMELVQPMGVILTEDCLAINFLFFVSWSLLSLVV